MMKYFEKVALILISGAIALIAITYSVRTASKIWSSLSPGQGELVGAVSSAIAVISGLVIAILVLQYQIGQEERKFQREIEHRREIVARTFLAPINQLAFSAISIFDAWHFGHSSYVNSDLIPVVDHHCLVLPSSAFKIAWPNIPSDEVASLNPHIAQGIHDLVNSCRWMGEANEKEDADFSSRFMTLASQITVIGQAIQLRFNLLVTLGYINEEDSQSKKARKTLKKVMKLAKK